MRAALRSVAQPSLALQKTCHKLFGPDAGLAQRRCARRFRPVCGGPAEAFVPVAHSSGERRGLIPKARSVALKLRVSLIAYLLSGHTLRILQDFTDDPALLKKAAAAFHGEPSGTLAATRVECKSFPWWLCEGVYEMRDAANVDRIQLTLSALSQIANHLACAGPQKPTLDLKKLSVFLNSYKHEPVRYQP